MPFDGTSANAHVVEMLNALIDYFKPYKNDWYSAHTDIAYALTRVRYRLGIRGDKTRIFILKAAEERVYYRITLAELDWMVADFASLENILLRARDLASGEPMRKSTWTPRQAQNICYCTPPDGRSSFFSTVRSVRLQTLNEN